MAQEQNKACPFVQQALDPLEIKLRELEAMTPETRIRILRAALYSAHNPNNT